MWHLRHPSHLSHLSHAASERPVAALQELNERQLTIIEGSVLSESDLQRVNAGTCEAALVMADRFTSNSAQVGHCFC
jgi:hypothetical protein